jgi:hypothetical protein
MRVAEKLALSCLLSMLPLVRTMASAQDPVLEKMIAAESSICGARAA